ncbi:hypothetical protein BHE74_00029042 [Ensete ventricosum]|nr:hypothetical protein BHE74_00029042 [Ensete ventricosum]
MQSNSIDWTGSLESSVTPFGRPLVRVRHWRRALLVREALMATSSTPPSSCTKNLLIRSTAATESREQDPKAQRTMACSCLPLLAHHSKTRLVPLVTDGPSIDDELCKRERETFQFHLASCNGKGVPVPCLARCCTHAARASWVAGDAPKRA